MNCMRTTLHLPETLWRSAKERAAREGRTLTDVVGAALRAYLLAKGGSRAYRLQWRTESGRPAPGLDLDSRRGLYEALGARGENPRP